MFAVYSLLEAGFGFVHSFLKDSVFLSDRSERQLRSHPGVRRRRRRQRRWRRQVGGRQGLPLFSRSTSGDSLRRKFPDPDRTEAVSG